MSVFDEGKQAWPNLQVSEAELATFLAQRSPLSPPPAADLFLVCGCLLGRADALAALEASVLSLIPGWVARIDASPDFGHDVAQAVRELLLTGARPRLGDYAGKGSLEGWVRVTAVRLALKARQRQPVVPALSADGPTADPGTEWAKAQGRAQVEQALEGVLAALDAEERAWLKLYYLDGLTLERVAALFGVHTSTISRRLAALEAQVFSALRHRLQGQLRLPSAEVDSLLRFVRSQLEVSLGRALKKTTD